MSVITMVFFLTDPPVRQVMQLLVVSYLDNFSVVCSSATERDKAVHLALHCSSRVSVQGMDDVLSRLQVEDSISIISLSFS